jgi:hypothetical protein
MRFETVSGKARIAANSWTIGKIRNAAGGRFGLIDAVHELIRGSLSLQACRTGVGLVHVRIGSRPLQVDTEPHNSL